MLLYRGPSKLASATIAAVLTGYQRPSRNVKTGPMAQLYIVRIDVHPWEAQQTGRDAAVCGDCPRSPLTAEALGIDPCYVITARDPASIWKALKQRSYRRTLTPRQAGRLATLPLRLGAYGDPAALPVAVLRQAIALTNGRWTAYTHQWRRAPYLRNIAMASCDNLGDQREAAERGWRTFTVTDHAGCGAGVTCPASAEARIPHGRTCSQCLLCDGRRGPTTAPAPVILAADLRQSVTIHSH